MLKHEYVSIEPLVNLIKERGYMPGFVYNKLSVNSDSFSQIKSQRVYPSSQFLASAAAFFKVPVSQIVSLTGYDIDPLYANRWDREEFNSIAFAVGLPDYSPLMDWGPRLFLNEPYRKQMPLVYDMFDGGDKYAAAGVEGRIKNVLLDRGIVMGSNPNARKKRPGLSQNHRAKLNRGEDVSMYVLYGLCEALHCNIDFIMQYK